MTGPSPSRSGHRIIVGVTGGIASYKVAHVVSALAQRGDEVTVVMTEAATRFVTPLTFQALSGRPLPPRHEALLRTPPGERKAAEAHNQAAIGPCAYGVGQSRSSRASASV